MDQFKDIEKPYIISKENLDDFRQKLEEKANLTDDQKRELSQMAYPVEAYQNLFDNFACVICDLFGYDPVICSRCDYAVMCRKCKDDWQRQRRGVFSCPRCFKKREPRNLNRMELASRNTILFKCKSKFCQKKDQGMTIDEYLKHQCIIKGNSFECPQSCGTFLKTVQEGETHYENCKNSIVSCLLCSSQVQRIKINDNRFQLILQNCNIVGSQKYKVPNFDDQMGQNSQDQIILGVGLLQLQTLTQNEFNRDPQISKEASAAFTQLKPIIMSTINGKYQNYQVQFDSNQLMFKKLSKIEIIGCNGIFNYTGMVNRNNQPHGFGRAIKEGGYCFYDGQFRDGQRHGFIRWIEQSGDRNYYEFKDGEFLRYL